MRWPQFHIGRPQRAAGALLLVFLLECCWIISRQQLSPQDYRFARCGREMWERPSPLAGYFTTCGNLNGDGTFAYRLAGLPLTVERLLLLAGDHLRAPENRRFASGSLNGSTWEARHELDGVLWLLHLPFVLFAMWLGAGLWWVARRLFGNEGGFFALGLYTFCPTVLEHAVTPNNEVLAMWGLYGLTYTAVGVAHAMQGPRRKWRPRLVLLTLALGFTAAAHLLAAFLGFAAALVLMLYLAERRRSYVLQILIFSALAALFMLFGFFSFRPAAFAYVFTGGGARFWFSSESVRRFVTDIGNAPIVIALAVSLLLWLAVRRSRYVGNTVPLIVGLSLLPIVTTQVISYPLLWALPFLFTFAGGVFADALETRQRKLFLLLSGSILITQATVCLAAIPILGRS